MALEPVINVWPGSSSFATGSTPYGYYDLDNVFASDIDKFSDWAARRLGYPIEDVELIDMNFYAAFEDAVTKYGTLVSLFNARDNLINLSGLPTGSESLTQQYIPSTLSGIFRLSKQYGTEAGSGGTQIYYTGSIALESNRQVYDLKDTGSVTLEAGDFSSNVFTIRKIFHNALPGANVDPYTSTFGNNQILSEFGWNDTIRDYTVMPLNYELLRTQAIEMSDQIRKSAYSFQLTGTRLRIFPIPVEDVTLYFHYTIDSDIMPISGSSSAGETTGVISDISNIPYDNVNYYLLNDLAKDWIKRYALTICKETLGLIRGKYSALPFGDSDITLNASDLLTQASAEQESLVTELKEILDSTSRQAQLERKQAEKVAMQEQLLGVPLKIYVR